MLYTNLR
jgi:hypothetical protein